MQIKKNSKKILIHKVRVKQKMFMNKKNSENINSKSSCKAKKVHE